VFFSLFCFAALCGRLSLHFPLYIWFFIAITIRIAIAISIALSLYHQLSMNVVISFGDFRLFLVFIFGAAKTAAYRSIF